MITDSATAFSRVINDFYDGERPGRERLALVAIGTEAEAAGFGPPALSSLFRSTAAEAGRAPGLVPSRSLGETAADRGVTVRPQLRAALAKSGTESPRDLVRLLGTIPQISLRVSSIRLMQPHGP